MTEDTVNIPADALEKHMACVDNITNLAEEGARRAAEAKQPNFRMMRDNALRLVEMLEGVSLMAGQGCTYETPICALTLRAQEMAQNMAEELKELM